VENGSMRNEWIESENVPLTNEHFLLSRMAITDENGSQMKMPVKNDLDIYVTTEFDLTDVDRSFQIGFAVYDSSNRLLFWSFSTDAPECSWPALSLGKNVLRTRLRNNLLNEGTYKVKLLAACYQREWILKPDDDNPSIYFEIKGGLSQSPYWYEKRIGILAPVLSWNAVSKG
jgi:lipopolysaccharide transport system ATP-binding protein